MTMLFAFLALFTLAKIAQAWFDAHPKVPDSPASLMTT